MKVLIFGYSDNPERYSHMANELLCEFGHEVLRVNLRNESEIELLKNEFHTLTLYVNPQLSDKYHKNLLASSPKRVIFNPGTENPSLKKSFIERGIEVIEGCTLVMLKTHQF